MEVENQYDPIIAQCNALIQTAGFSEGCIFDDALDTTKTREACVVDETAGNQHATYCDGCLVDEGCNLVHSFKKQQDDDGNVEVEKIAKSCDGILEEATPENGFCFLKNQFILGAIGFPSEYGVTFIEESTSSVFLTICPLIDGGFYCDGSPESNAASAQDAVDTLIAHAGCNDLQDAFTRKMESGECQCE